MSFRLLTVPAATEEGAAFRARRWMAQQDFRSLTVGEVLSVRPIVKARFDGEWLVKVAVTETERKP